MEIFLDAEIRGRLECVIDDLILFERFSEMDAYRLVRDKGLYFQLLEYSEEYTGMSTDDLVYKLLLYKDL